MTNTTPIRFLSFDELKGFGIRLLTDLAARA